MILKNTPVVPLPDLARQHAVAWSQQEVALRTWRQQLESSSLSLTPAELSEVEQLLKSARHTDLATHFTVIKDTLQALNGIDETREELSNESNEIIRCTNKVRIAQHQTYLSTIKIKDLIQPIAKIIAQLSKVAHDRVLTELDCIADLPTLEAYLKNKAWWRIPKTGRGADPVKLAALRTLGGVVRALQMRMNWDDIVSKPHSYFVGMDQQERHAWQNAQDEIKAQEHLYAQPAAYQAAYQRIIFQLPKPADALTCCSDRGATISGMRDSVVNLRKLLTEQLPSQQVQAYSNSQEKLESRKKDIEDTKQSLEAQRTAILQKSKTKWSHSALIALLFDCPDPEAAYKNSLSDQDRSRSWNQRLNYVKQALPQLSQKLAVDSLRAPLENPIIVLNKQRKATEAKIEQLKQQLYVLKLPGDQKSPGDHGYMQKLIGEAISIITANPSEQKKLRSHLNQFQSMAQIDALLPTLLYSSQHKTGLEEDKVKLQQLRCLAMVVNAVNRTGDQIEVQDYFFLDAAEEDLFKEAKTNASATPVVKASKAAMHFLFAVFTPGKETRSRVSHRSSVPEHYRTAITPTRRSLSARAMAYDERAQRHSERRLRLDKLKNKVEALNKVEQDLQQMITPITNYPGQEPLAALRHQLCEQLQTLDPTALSTDPVSRLSQDQVYRPPMPVPPLLYGL